MIKLNQVSTGYGPRAVVTDISLTLRPGSITALLGKNGAGKTTLLRCLSGALPYGGSITLDGQELRDMKPRERARHIGIMPQLLPGPQIPVRELVSYGRQPHAGFLGQLSPGDWEQIDRAMEQAGISRLADQSVADLSGGERQKAYFALLLAQDPEVLILDEPGAYLDADAAAQLYGFLEAARNQGKTVLTVLHDVNRALEIAGQLVVLGDVPFVGTPADFLAQGIPQEVFHLQRFDGVGEDGERTVFFR